jgi:Protein of unknown function (DUF559)
VAELAGRQRGVVSVDELRHLRVTDDEVESWVERGRLHRLHEGVYAVGHRALPPGGRFLAAVLAGGQDASLAQLSAAAHRGLRRDAPGDVDVIVVRSGERDREGIRFHRPRIYDPALDTEIVDGIRCTTVARTLVDLAGVLRYDRLEAAVERAEYLRLLDLKAIADVLARISRPRGVSNLRRCLGPDRLAAAMAGSDLERDYLRLILGAGIARPVLQAPFELTPGEWVRADFYWPARRLIIEADGPHHALPLQAAKDARRDRLLTAMGERVHRFPHTEIEETPELVIATTRALLHTSRDD